MIWIKGVDASFDTLTPKKAKALREDGFEVYWQCLWTGGQRPGPAIENLQVARANGFTICGYISVAPHHTGSWHVLRGREGIPQDLWDDLVLVVVDVELEGIPNEMIREAVEALAIPVPSFNKRRAIYTAYFAWVGQQGDPQDFTDCLLCNALWDGNEDFDFPSLPYGGWTPEQVVCEQYTGGGDVWGLNADLDVWNEELLLQGDERMKYTDEKLDAAFTAVLTTLASALDLANEAGNAISHHVNTHPGGGPTITTAGEMQALNDKINANEAELAKFKTAIEAATHVS